VRHLVRTAKERHGVVALILDGRFALPGEPVQRGGHAQLFKGTDLEQDNQVVAVKLFKPPHVVDDRVLRASWTNELTAYQALGTHENLARLIDFGRTQDGEPYLVFEWLDSDLFEYLRRISIEGWDDFWPLGRNILNGLSKIHSAGYVHRDLKPENLLIAADGSLKVADFGTARLTQATNLGITMAPYGTVPYAPPERGTATPAPSYDLYSFGVICIVGMTRQVPSGDFDVVAEFDQLDLPKEIAELIRPCLDEDPDNRPESAGILLASLTSTQERREKHRGTPTEVFLDISSNIAMKVEQLLGLPSGTGTSYITDDLSSIAGFAYDDTIQAAPDLQIAGQVLLYRAQPHNRMPGVLHVARVVRPPAQVLETARSTWYRPQIQFRTTVPTDPARAQHYLLRLQEQVVEHDAEREDAAAAARESEAFAPWRKLLRARFAVEDERGKPVRFQSFTPSGTRIRFRISALPNIEVGESRLVRVGRRRVLFGEVEGVENNELILYVTKGKSSDLPRSGVLEFDAEASKSKLRREQAAIERIAAGAAVRPDLKDILLEPRISRKPDPVSVEEYFNQDLDDPKKQAVSDALAAKDFLIVQGPPGTGKTTFISELVAQSLRDNPDYRILLASQTHIALDNALSRVRSLCPTAKLVRIGKEERITTDIEELSLESRLEAIRQDVILQGREFLKEYAAALGIDLKSADIETLATELSLKIKRTHDQRSRIALRQTERRKIVSDIDELRALAPGLIEAAAALEQAAAASSGVIVQDAVRNFIDAGISAAATLEASAPLSGKLVEIESTLASWRQQLNEDLAAEQSIGERLADLLDQPHGMKSSDLLDLATKRTVASDPRLDKLRIVAEDWEARFGRSPEFAAVVIASSNVVAATCVGLAGVPGAQSIPFDICIIDEASKATPTEALVPLASSRRWILVGDDKQLPPFVERVLETPEMLDRFGLTREAVHETLFKMLADRLPSRCQVALTHQHRMHPAIGQLISECFYGGMLTSAQRTISPVVETAFKSPVLWADTRLRRDRRESTDGTTFRNRGEARVIAQLLDRLNWIASKQNTYLSIAVLAAYDGQRRELTNVLEVGESSRANLTVRIANVDAYQGQEADVAFFSITRSNETGDLGFLRSEQRINVALSRARDALVIVGDSEFITGIHSASNPLSQVLLYMRSNPASSAMELMTTP
jgi:AAA domain/Protein kinase domain